MKPQKINLLLLSLVLFLFSMVELSLHNLMEGNYVQSLLEKTTSLLRLQIFHCFVSPMISC